MNGVTFITDETHSKRYVQLDLDEVAKIGTAELEDIFDIIVAESRRNEDKISLEELGRQLEDEGLL